MAFSEGHVGMANTPVEHDIQFPLPVLNEGPEKEEYRLMLSYKTRYEQRFGGCNYENYLSELREVNLPGAVMFMHSFGPMSHTPEGVLDHQKAFLMRHSVGAEEFENFVHMKQMASRIPFYTLDVKEGTNVKQVGLVNSSRATVTAEHIPSRDVSSYNADLIRLNTGTTLTNPIRDLSVKEVTFCHRMNSCDLRAFFKAKKMLNSNGMLIPGKKIISGGLSLSGLDQIAALSTIMNLFEEDKDSILGYRVTDFAKRNYSNAIALVNRTPGTAVAPRHSFTHRWQQGTPVIGSTENLHALFLHSSGEDVFQVWYDIMECHVARAVGSTPDKIHSVCTTEDILQSQFTETEWHLECRRLAGICETQGDFECKDWYLELSTRTLSGAKRQAILNLIIGFGLENKEAAQTAMEKLAPITWKGRQGYLYHRAQIAAITNPKMASKVSNMPSIRRLNDFMRYIGASPVEVQSMFHLLIEAGIARYKQASYSSIVKDPRTGRLDLHGELFDAVLVSPVMTKESDDALRSLTPQVTTVGKSSDCIPKVGTFRRFSNHNGTPMPIECNNLLGKGFMSKTESGEDSLLCSYGYDVNNRDSAVNEAASYTVRRMALAHLQACGLDAYKTLDKIYDEQAPTVEDYESEVQRFEEHFRAAYEIWAYMKAIKAVAGDDSEVFSNLFDKGRTVHGRMMTIQVLAESNDISMTKAAARYYKDVAKTPSFNPPRMEEFFERFVDPTEESNARAYERAVEICKEHLLRRQ